MVAHTAHLYLQPLEGCAAELFIRRAVCEAVGDGDVGEELEDATLHSQFVQVGVQEGKHALGQIGAVNVAGHGDWV